MHNGMLINLMLLNDFGSIFTKSTSNSSINDRFYKGSVTAFWRLRNYMFLQGIVRVSNIAKVSHRILINIMVFKGIQCPFGGIGTRIMNILQVL